ncbi:MAG TPA: 50S ribosomal protein L10 [Archaeoglobus profundus]|nr:50S ribosomal protein L10 [Archaeoglobus profundus]
MTRENKNVIVDFLSEEFKTSGAIIVASYKGSSHKNLEQLRVSADEAEVNVKVAKNKLVGIALKNAELPELELNEENIFIWAENQVAACKVADKFATANKETFIIKTGIIEGEVADLATINAFAKLPGREELLGMLAATWMAPVANFTIGLDALRKKKEEAA